MEIKVSKWSFFEVKKFLDKVFLNEISRKIEGAREIDEERIVKIIIKDVLGLKHIAERTLFYNLIVQFEIYLKGFANPREKKLYSFYSLASNDLRNVFKMEVYSNVYKKEKREVGERFFSRKEVEEILKDEFFNYYLGSFYNYLMDKTFLRKGWLVIPRNYLNFFKNKLFEIVYKGG